MTQYTDVFGSQTLPPSEYGYQALSISTNTTLVWPYNSDGGTVLSKIIDLTATVSSLTLTLPNATEVSTGEDCLIKNVGGNSVIVANASGGTIGTVAPGYAKYFYLSENSTAAGTWGTVDYGIGTSLTDAATLVGYGIMAIGATLNQSHPVFTTAANITIDATYRSTVVNYTGGVGTIDLTAAMTLGNNFFTVIRNSGTGTLSLVPNGVDTIDGLNSFALQPSESLILCCSGSEWFSVGYGRSVNYNFTQLVLDVTAAGTFTLNTSQAANKLLTFVGSPGSAVTVVVPNVVSVYYVLSNISTPQNITVKTAAGTGTVVPQSQRIVAICDATNVYSAQSVTSNTSLSLMDGSVTVPALNFASSTNTGLYKYGTNGIGFAVNGISLAYMYDSEFIVDTTASIRFPVGTTAQRPTGAVGKVRFNSDSSRYEGYNGTNWSSLGGGATGGGSDEVFMENGMTVTTSYTLTTSKNALSVGPITVNSGINVTIPSGQRWVVL